MLTACLVFAVLVAAWGSPTPRVLRELMDHHAVEAEPAEPAA